MGLGTNDISMVAVGTGINTTAYSSDNGLNWTGTTSVFAGSSIEQVYLVGDRFIATSNDAQIQLIFIWQLNWTGTGNSLLTTVANAVIQIKLFGCKW